MGSLRIRIIVYICKTVVHVSCYMSVHSITDKSDRAARRLHFGSFRKFQLDDYIMTLTIVRLSDSNQTAELTKSKIPFTVVIVASNQISKSGSNYSRLHPGNTIINDDEREAVILGSKMSFVVEECLVVTINLLKACLLLMYHRFT